MGDPFWKSTQELLQSGDNALVRKPKLTEQLLQRPPFRFLHDVITAVQNSAGFAPGLYSGEELDSRAIKDKERKVSYLSKMIAVVGLCLGTTVPANPLKIVAGLEAENTNVFLQMLGKAAQMGDGRDAVQRVLGGEQRGEERSDPARPSSRPSSQQSGRLTRQGSSNKSDTQMERAAASAVASTVSPPPNPAPPHQQPAPGAGSQDRRASETGPSEPNKRPTQSVEGDMGRERSQKKSPRSAGKKRSSGSGEDRSLPGPPQNEPGPQGSEAGGEGRSPLGAADANKPPINRRPARPQSAKKAPPKVKSNDQSQRKPMSSGPGRPGTASSSRASSSQGSRPAKHKVFEEGTGSDEDNDDIEIVTESGRLDGAGPGISSQADKSKGALVKDILEVQERLKEEGTSSGGKDGGDEQEGQGIVLQPRRRRKNDRQGKMGDLERIREVVQTLCQSATPLGRCLEFLQEDMDAMGKELRFWTTEQKVYEEKLNQSNADAEDLGAMESQIQEAEDQVQQAKERILALKAQVLNNHETVVKLLEGVSSRNR